MTPVYMKLYMVEHLKKIATVFFWSPLHCEKELEQIIARTPSVMHQGKFRVERIFINDAISLDFRAQNFPLIFPY